MATPARTMPDPYAVPPEQRWHGVNTGKLSERIAAAQKRLRDTSKVSTTLESGELDQYQALWRKDEITAIVHDLGLSNQAGSYAFVRRFLELEELVFAQNALLTSLNATVFEASEAHRKLALRVDPLEAKRK